MQVNDHRVPPIGRLRSNHKTRAFPIADGAAKGSLRFDLEDMTRLKFLDATEAPNLHAYRDILTAGPDHPYSTSFWKAGHITGYEHTFIATLADFLQSLDRGAPFHPTIADALETQKLLAAVESSAASGHWLSL